MKLISLNTWGGRAGVDKLLAFFEKNKGTDIFCLQEVWDGGEKFLGISAGGMPLAGVHCTLLSDIASILKEHDVHFRPHVEDCYGLATFIRRDINLLEEGEQFVYMKRGWVSDDDKANHARNIQYITIDTEDGPRTIVNFHGLWNGKGKGDCRERLEQSENIVTFLKTLDTPLVFVGDFNLLPETESIQKFEKFGLRNLISECGITSTRTSFYKKEHRHADYALVSDDVQVIDFKVLGDEVSDHAPLFLNFE